MAKESDIGAAAEYLGSYRLIEKWLRSNRYEREYFGAPPSGDDVFLQAKLFEIRSFVSSLPNCREKLFLNCYYVRGHSVEKCAELMDISVRSAYRIKKNALSLAASRLQRERGTEERSGTF